MSFPKSVLPHLDDDCIQRYHLGQITEEAELQRVEAHLAVCVSCRERAVSVEDSTTILRLGFPART